MSLPPIYVINLERSTARRQHMEQELGRFGVDYAFFAATDGRMLTADDQKHYSAMRALALTGVHMSHAEIGCALSHVRVYEKMVAEGIHELLVVEDDCVFSDHFFEVLACRERWLPSDWEMVNFAYAINFATNRDKNRHVLKEMEAFSPVRHVQVSAVSMQLMHIRVPPLGDGVLFVPPSDRSTLVGTGLSYLQKS